MLRDGTGNCLGLSSLYLALGERLGLPLFGVVTPRHVFVRFDDGTTRVNIELTEGGAAHEDEHYIDRDDRLRIDPASLEKGVFLQDLTKRQMLSQVLTNAAARLLRIGRPAEALIAIERAIRLHPLNGSAYLGRAQVRFRLSREDERVLPDIETAKSLHPLTFEGRTMAAGMLFDLERYGEALSMVDQALAPDPLMNPCPHLAAARALLLHVPGHAGEAEKALRVLDEIKGIEDLTNEERQKQLLAQEPIMQQSKRVLEGEKREFVLLRERVRRALADEDE